MSRGGLELSELSKAWLKLETVVGEGTGFVRLRLSEPSPASGVRWAPPK